MMRPTWWEGYYHLGRAQFECEELEQAKTSLTTALALNPSNEQVQTELSNVEHELGRKSDKTISKEHYPLKWNI
uniref:Tetratricopeptide repeat protein n=1 Tax=Ditylenchus dipsaci TaxID=166011 RepID=A0A915DPP1_9BILA